MKKYNLPYVVITPAHNESEFIEELIESMIVQTILPLRWVIVSDGSTDGTDEIIKKYTKVQNWIKLLRINRPKERNFAGKVMAFNEGLKSLSNIPYEIISNVDADISFKKDHFEYLLDKFKGNPNLGVAGTAFIEAGQLAYNYKYTNINHVSGQCQLFRRKCFEEIGGYLPIKSGGVDWTAVTTARMIGWDTKTFTGRTFCHNRKMGTSTANEIAAQFKFGKQDYYLGSHPLWEILRCIYQMKKKPYFIRGLSILLGYVYGSLKQLEKPISLDLVHYRRKEQMQRLKIILKKISLYRIVFTNRK